MTLTTDEKREKNKIACKKYRDAHIEQARENEKLYRESHRKECSNSAIKWKNRNRERWEQNNINCKAIKNTHHLGWNLLNQPFENSHAHHINPIDVIFIPNILHKSIYHRLDDAETMKLINQAVLEYLNPVMLKPFKC